MNNNNRLTLLLLHFHKWHIACCNESRKTGGQLQGQAIGSDDLRQERIRKGNEVHALIVNRLDEEVFNN